MRRGSVFAGLLAALVAGRSSGVEPPGAGAVLADRFRASLSLRGFSAGDVDQDLGYVFRAGLSSGEGARLRYEVALLVGSSTGEGVLSSGAYARYVGAAASAAGLSVRGVEAEGGTLRFRGECAGLLGSLALGEYAYAGFRRVECGGSGGGATRVVDL